MFEDLKQNAPNTGAQGNTQTPATPQPVTDMFADVDPNNQNPAVDKTSAVQSGKMKPVSNTNWSPNVSTGSFTPEQMLVTDVKGGKTAKLVVILVVVLLVLAAGAAAYYFLVMKKNTNLVVDNTNVPLLNNNINKGDNLNSNTNAALDMLDSDSDGLTDAEEKQLDTDPLNPDVDNDSLSDRDEVKVYKTNPLLVDTDGDGLSDGEEVEIWRTDPLLSDTDGDGYLDGLEVNNGFNPLGSGKLSSSTLPIDLNSNN